MQAKIKASLTGLHQSQAVKQVSEQEPTAAARDQGDFLLPTWELVNTPQLVRWWAWHISTTLNQKWKLRRNTFQAEYFQIISGAILTQESCHAELWVRKLHATVQMLSTVLW